MEEINHFMHQQHPLKLLQNLEGVVGVGVVNCVGCLEPISGGSTYGCIRCHYFVHKACAELPPTFNHRFHPLHPLKLMVNDFYTWDCDGCDNRILKGAFVYHCRPCNFGVCLKCTVAAIVAIALKEESLIKFRHEGHPQHTLTLQLRPASFYCDACHTKDEDLFYICDGCDYWIHKSCTSMASTLKLPHHHHSLLLVHSLPDTFYKFQFFCAFCNKYITRRCMLYHCANCRYFVHIKCAKNAPNPDSIPRVDDVEDNSDDFLHFPMSDAFTDPLKLLHSEKYAQDDNENKEINRWSHDRPLILNVEPQLQGNNVMPNIGCSDPIEVCDGCVRPLSLPYYSCKHGCSFTLHKYCAELPLILQHQLHPDHSLHLVDTSDDDDYYRCNGCFSEGNRFVYKCTETCAFYLDVNCAFLPNAIKHEHHNHPLIQVIDPETTCNACYKWFGTTGYSCKPCDFLLGLHCAIRSPHFLAHRYCKGHDIPLTRLPVEDHPEDFYCDICEEEMHPLQTIYHCLECKNSFHLNCLSRIDGYANVKHDFTKTFSFHKHPLTFVRRKKSPDYVCFGCNLDINGHLILECRTGTCPYRICMSCSFREML